MIDDHQGCGGDGHPEEVEEERGGVLKGVLDEDEGCSPYHNYCEKKEMREGVVGGAGGHRARGEGTRPWFG